MPAPKFDGDVIILTGAAEGLGKAYAHALAASGARLVLNDIAPEVEAFAGKLAGQGTSVVAVAGDVSDPATVAALRGAALEHFGRIDAIINNAGIAQRKSTERTSLADLRKLMEVNYFAAIALIEACLPTMIAQGYGRIVNVISTSLFGATGFSAYAATKGALLGYTRCAALDLARHGIAMNLLAPGAYTPMTRNSDLEPEAVERLAISAPPEKVAPVAAWLVHPSCDCGGVAFSAAAGRASLIALVESQSIPVEGDLDIHKELSGLVGDSRGLSFPIRESLRS